MIITDTAGMPKPLPTGSSGQVLQLVGGMPPWCDTPLELSTPTKGPLTLRCGACGTKHEANTKRCGACGCSDRLEQIVSPKPEAIITRRKGYFSVVRRMFSKIDIYPFSSGGTESPGPN